MILAFVVVVLAIRNHNKESETINRLALEKGSAIIRSVEAGTRAGMLRMRWGRVQLQTLLQEMGHQPGVNGIAVVSENGKILGHSDGARVGGRMDSRLLKRSRPGEHYGEKIGDVADAQFIVWGEFKPSDARKGGDHMGHGMHMRDGRSAKERIFPDEKKRLFIQVTLSLADNAVDLKKDLRATMVISALLLILGCGGIAAIYGFQGYRAARASLSDTSAMAREVVSSIPVGLMVMDSAHRLTFMNGVAEAMTGRTSEAVEGREAKALFPGVMAVVTAHLKEGGAFHEKEHLVALHETGAEMPVSISASSIVGEKGLALGQVVILRDLTQVKRLEKELRQKETLAAIGDMAAGVAHEIRNPLSSIKGIATYFRSLFDENHDAREAAGVLVDEVDRLNRAVTELLTIAGPTKLVVSEQNVQELVLRAQRLVEADAQVRGVAVAFDGPEEKVMARLDADRITQSLLNLFLNAIQAMDQGGTLSVALSTKSENLSLAISDTGCGMDAETLKSIFDPYFTTRAEGTGLGLAIVHKIVEAHGGRLDVTSEPGAGSRFVMTLPLNGNDA